MSSREADRQEQLLEIAQRLFARQGFAGTSLRDIANEAGITKAALYYHFPNKDALYAKIVLAGVRKLYDTVSGAVARAANEPSIEQVRVFMDASADYIERYRDGWLASTNAFWASVDAKQRADVVRYRDAYEGLLRQSIAKGVASGELRSDIDPAMAGRMLLSMLNHFVRWYKPGGALTARQVIGQFVDMTLRGLADPVPGSERKLRA
ncbi:MAG: TetR family transcriptional regulator [Burkholderiales bacterium]|nr:TetR family transcriptional regulator [Burkholderiales bacterium]